MSRCEKCGFDYSVPIGETLGFQPIWSYEMAEILMDPDRRHDNRANTNGMLHKYHIGHIVGALECRITEDGWMQSRGIGINQMQAFLN